MTHTLKVGICLHSDSSLEGLRAFWELESLGISTNDKSVYDDFCVQIQFKNGRYEVALPWKQPCPDLQINYTRPV